MPSLLVEKPGAVIRLQSERLAVTVPDSADPAPQLVPLEGLERIVLHEGCQISSQALAAAMRAGIPVHVLSFGGRHLGVCEGRTKAAGHRRLLQYQRTQDAAWALAVAARLVAAKIANQGRCLRRLAARRSAACEDPVRALEVRSAATANAAGLPELRGMEGAAAALYFPVWASFLPPEFPFLRRMARPPGNAVNACLSFGSALIYGEMLTAIRVAGLDPALGVLHTTEDGRWSLALDLMEPLRPTLIEPLTQRCLALRVLDAGDFEARDGGVFLNASGRRKFLRQYEQRLTREHFSEQLGHRTTLRRILQREADSFRAALETPEGYAPFLVNA